MKNMKRIALVFVAMMCVLTMAWSVAAEGTPTVTVGTVPEELANVNVDDTFDVDVSIENNPGIINMSLKVTYDSKLELINVADTIATGFMPSQANKNDLTSGNFKLSWADLNASTDYMTNGSVCTLTFKLKEVPASAETLSVSLSYDPADISNAAMDNVAFATVDGGIDLTYSDMSNVVKVSAKKNLVYDGTTRNTVDLIDIDGAPAGYTPTCVPESVTGAYDGSVTVKINAPGYVECSKSTFLHIAKAEAEISGLLAYDKDYDGTKDVTLEVTDETVIDGLLGTDAAIAEFVTGYTFTGLLADAEIGKNKPVVAVKNAADVLGAAAANYDLVIAEGITANVTKTSLIPVNAASITDYSKVQVTTADSGIVEVNLNKSASKGDKVDNGDGTHTLKFVAAFNNEADADNYDATLEVIVPDANIVTFVPDAGMTLGTIDNLPNDPAMANEGYYIRGMNVVITATPAKSSYRLNRIEINGQSYGSTASFYISLDPSTPNRYTVNAVFTKKTAVYPAPGTDKNIIEQTKSNKIVLTIGSTEATVFGTKKINDVAPIIINDRTMLPARFVAEALGAKVEWDDAAKKVSIFKDMKKIEIYIGKAEAYINGQAVALDSPALIQNSRTYMPVRFIAESLGANVKWNDVTRQVVITK